MWLMTSARVEFLLLPYLTSCDWVPERRIPSQKSAENEVELGCSAEIGKVVSL